MTAQTSPGMDFIYEYKLRTTNDILKLGVAKPKKNDEETSIEDLPQKSFPPVYVRGAKTSKFIKLFRYFANIH